MLTLMRTDRVVWPNLSEAVQHLCLTDETAVFYLDGETERTLWREEAERRGLLIAIDFDRPGYLADRVWGEWYKNAQQLTNEGAVYLGSRHFQSLVRALFAAPDKVAAETVLAILSEKPFFVSARVCPLDLSKPRCLP